MDECRVKNELIERLSKGDHVVSFEDRIPELERVEERVRSGFVFIKFMQTRGGTELGLNLIQNECDFSKVDFKEGCGNMHVVGTCELNYCKVKCIADIDLKTKEGTGHLELV